MRRGVNKRGSNERVKQIYQVQAYSSITTTAFKWLENLQKRGNIHCINTAVLNTLPDHAWISNGISNQVVRQWQSLGQLDEQVGREWSFELVSDQSASLSVITHSEV